MKSRRNKAIIAKFYTLGLQYPLFLIIAFDTKRIYWSVEQVDAWMSSNRLRINADRTQLIWLGTKQQLDKLSMTELDLLSARVRFSTAVSDLGVLVDSQLSMADHVVSLSRTCLFQLRQLRIVR